MLPDGSNELPGMKSVYMYPSIAGKLKGVTEGKPARKIRAGLVVKIA